MAKKRRVGKTSTLKTFETVPKEQQDKRIVIEESIDYRGLVKRSRIHNQTGFDQLYIDGVIDAAQHEAAHIFLGAITRSGCFIQASDPESMHYTPFSKIGDSISSRVMAFSSAYRRVQKRLNNDCANHLVVFILLPYEPKECVRKYQDRIREIKLALEELSVFYGTIGREDPRKLVSAKLG